jgi:phage host-nuclease inhibitor protein Gam
MSENTPEKPSLLERAKDLAENFFHREEAAHPKLTAEVVQEVENVKADFERFRTEAAAELAKFRSEATAEISKLRAELSALAAQVVPAAEADLKEAASAVEHDVEQAVQSAVSPSSTPPAAQ